jgi:hypothetical protein
MSIMHQHPAWYDHHKLQECAGGWIPVL